MLTLFLILIAGMLNVIMDLCGNFDETLFSKIHGMRAFMEGGTSWRNKYKNGDRSQGPKFFLSTKALVCLTDMWHLCKTLMMLFICLATVLYILIFVWYLEFLIYWIAFGTSFTIFYDYGFRLKKFWAKPW